MWTWAAVDFENVAPSSGVAHQHANLTEEVLNVADDMARISGGAAAGDFDGDGWMDLYVTRINLPNQLFFNFL